MVELRKENDIQGPVITGFSPRGFKVGDVNFDHGILISPQEAVSWDAPALVELDFSSIVSTLNLHPKPEFLLFGSGPGMSQPPGAFRREMEAAGMGIEVMDSRAAARTWGILRAEERWIIGALMPLV